MDLEAYADELSDRISKEVESVVPCADPERGDLRGDALRAVVDRLEERARALEATAP